MNHHNVKARQPVRGILFDKDGTLLDFTPTWLPAYQAGALFAAGGDEAKARHMMVSTGLDEQTDDFAHGSLLASATTDQIAEAWIARDGKSLPGWLQQGFGILESGPDAKRIRELKLRTSQIVAHPTNP